MSYIVKTPTFLLTLLLLCLVVVPAFAGPFNTEAQDGVDYYNQEEYAEALKNFEAARLADPEDGNVLYNLANTHYKLGNFDSAVEALQAAESKFNDPVMKQKAQYNLGNTYYRMGNMDRAIQSYKKALELNPEDTDSKFNLEFARKQKRRAQRDKQFQPKGKDQQQKPRENGLNPSPPKDSGQSDKKPEDEGGSKSAKSEDQKEEQEKNSSAGEKPSDKEAPPKPEESESDSKMAKAMQEVTSMNKDEADRWLNSLNEDLKKMSKRQVQGQMKDLFVEGGKDW